MFEIDSDVDFTIARDPTTFTLLVGVPQFATAPGRGYTECFFSFSTGVVGPVAAYQVVIGEQNSLIPANFPFYFKDTCGIILKCNPSEIPTFSILAATATTYCRVSFIRGGYIKQFGSM